MHCIQGKLLNQSYFHTSFSSSLRRCFIYSHVHLFRVFVNLDFYSLTYTNFLLVTRSFVYLFIYFSYFSSLFLPLPLLFHLFPVYFSLIFIPSHLQIFFSLSLAHLFIYFSYFLQFFFPPLHSFTSSQTFSSLLLVYLFNYSLQFPSFTFPSSTFTLPPLITLRLLANFLLFVNYSLQFPSFTFPSFFHLFSLSVSSSPLPPMIPSSPFPYLYVFTERQVVFVL